VVNEFHAKNKGKFDTVGVGINETVERSMYRQLSINMRDFSEKSDDEITQTLKKIEHEYLPFRIEKLGLPKDEFWKFYNDIVKKDSMIESFLKIRQWMNDKLIVVWPDDSVIDKFLAKDPKRKVVFEAGQGLLLDQHRKEFFPYLTRSSTGMTNILELLQTVRSRLDLQVLLVTRTYLTRHGDGPIWNHVPNTYPFPKIEEPTNPDHTFQGKMRYGHLSMAWYKKAIEETKTLIDKHRPECLLSTFTEVAMTCLDQVGDEFSYSLDGGGDITKGEVRDFPKIKLLSSGHTEKDIKPV
jgi:adenylosuccinate synthase